jgi:hypothetical protein
MVSRALDNIVDEMEAMGQGLTTGQAEDVTAIVKSLMEKNTQDSLSDAQAEEVADIVDALTFELRSELKVLGADLDAVESDLAEVQETVAKLKSDMPQDNIEFGMDIKTLAEVAYYGENEKEERAVLEMLQDGDAIDEDFTDDPDLFPAQERFWQEYEFNIAGELNGADFNLNVDTITNLFMDERSVLDYTENDANEFLLDTALLEVSFDNTDLKIGDMPDYYPETYFLDEDFEGIEVNTTMYNTDFKAFAGGNDEDNDDNTNELSGDDTDPLGSETEMADEKYFGLVGERETELGIFTGKVYHARNVVDTDVVNNTDENEKRYVDSPYESTLVGLGLDTEINDAWNMGGEVVFGQFEDENGNDGDDMYAVVNTDYAVSEAFNVNGMVEYAGEEFVGVRNDLEEAFGDYTLVKVGADYQLNENNNVNGFVKFAQAGDLWETVKNTPTTTDDKMVANIGLDNTYGKFTNRAFVEYTESDNFVKDQEEMLFSVGTEYAYDETMTMGANLNYKTEELASDDVKDYVYLTGFVDKLLKENINWLTEAMVIDGTTDMEWENYPGDDLYIPYNAADMSEDDVDGTGYALTTSLSVSF